MKNKSKENSLGKLTVQAEGFSEKRLRRRKWVLLITDDKLINYRQQAHVCMRVVSIAFSSTFFQYNITSLSLMKSL